MTAPSQPRHLRKRIRWIALVGGLLLLVWLGFRPKAVEVDLAEITRGLLEVTVDEDGETRIREPYLISAPLGGRLIRVELEPGDIISEGQVLAAIDPGEPGLLDARSRAEAEARLKAAEAAHKRTLSQVEIARAEAEKAERYVERDRRLLEKGSISPPMFEDTRHALRVALGSLTAAQSSEDVARFEMDQAEAALVHSRSLGSDETLSGREFKIRSPIDGVVLRRFQESSTMLTAASGILEIGDPEDLEVRIDVLSEDAVKIQPGQPVRLVNWGGNGVLNAHIRRVEPSAFTKVSALGVDEQRVWVYADFAKGGDEMETLDPEIPAGRALLGDGYRVEAQVVVWKKDDAIKAPSGSLFRNEADGGWAVYRVVEGRAVLTPVTRAQDNGIEAEITEGLDEGDQVILHPGDRVADGVRIEGR
ncbi:MAG: HlyD family efflux transporter periplasmic adaptor subunit [Verrucomicrobiales bacterium]|nr:HlyD family efflux transporter periplasmic adaptor subunit [Verrucomicrobiales bacterium]